MKKIMMVGTQGSGKTTLLQALKGEELIYRKTLDLVFDGNFIDTPGEYFDNKFFKNSLLVTSSDADIVLFVQASDDPDTMFQPLLSTMFNAEVIGVVTKTDLFEKDVKRAEQILEFAGCRKIFLTSSIDKSGIIELLDYIAGE